MTKDDAPILIVHGDQDPLVPFQQSVQFNKKLDEASVSSPFIRMTNGGHGFASDELTKRVQLFLDQHVLKGASQTPTKKINETPITVPQRRPRQQ